MLKIVFLLLLLAPSAHSQSMSVNERRKNILTVVDEELAEVSRLAKQQNYSSPDTLLRISELNMEKARLWREVENEKFLSVPPAERRKAQKKDYFKTSNKYFKAANKSAAVVVKRFPTYRGLGDVYYILAYNNKELGNNEAAQKYFKISTDKAGSNSKVAFKSKLALADYYYNDRDYKKAIPLYEASLNKLDEKWWTKDAFNLAWSYYRVKKYPKAISLMKDVHRKSGEDKYVNMRSMVERDIGVFFVDAGKMDEAAKFYQSLGLNYTEQFIRIASNIMTQGRFSQAESLLEQAAKSEQDRDKKIQIYMAQLELFDKFDKTEAHLKVSQELLKLHQQKPLSADEVKRFTYQVNKKAAELQKKTASDIYKDVPKVRKSKASQAIAFFEISSQLTPGDNAEKTFFQGETAYAANDYLKAIKLYLKAFDEAKPQDSKIKSQSLEGMLASLGSGKIKEKTAEKYYSPVYTRYLAFDSRSQRANSIFVKLFNTQFSSGDVKASEKTMEDFARNFPKDYKTQEGMLAKVMEYYRNKKSNDTVKSYVSKINAGQFQVSKKYADALRNLMTKLQIDGVQQSLAQGHKGVAMKGYHQIYESQESTPKAKVNAAYNLSALYYEMGNPKLSYKWGVTALKDMESADVIKFSDSFLSISSGLFLRQHFTESADLSSRILMKLCKEDSSNKTVAYKNAVFITLANDDIDRAITIKNQGKPCLIPDATVSEVSFELLKELADKKRWETLESLILELEKISKNSPQLIKPYEDLRQTYLAMGDEKKAREIEGKQKKLYELSKSQKLDIPVEALDLISFKMLDSVVAKKQKLESVSLKFPEAEFNAAVKTKLQILDQLTSEVTEIQKVGSGKGIVEAYKYVISAYENFGGALKSFVPEGKSPEYVESFNKAMSEVYNPILANARKQRNEIKKLIHDNKILTLSNYNVLYPASDTFKRFLTKKQAVLMDRGGKR